MRGTGNTMAHVIVGRVHTKTPRVQVTLNVTSSLYKARVKAYPWERQEFTSAFHATLARLMAEYTTLVSMVHSYASDKGKAFKALHKTIHKGGTVIGLALDSSLLAFTVNFAKDISVDLGMTITHNDIMRMVVNEMSNPVSKISRYYRAHLPMR
jgi:hypothetical protein